MALGGCEVHEPAVRDQVEPPSVLELELVHELSQRPGLGRQGTQRRDLDLDVEVPRVREHRAVLHPLDVLAGDDRLVAGRRHEDVPDLGRALHRQHLEPVHRGLERPERIDLGDDHVRAHALRPHGDAAATPAVAGDDELPAGEEDVRRTDDPVDRRLAGPVAVVEEVLGLRVVHRDDREPERAVALERTEADHAGGRLLGAADDVAELLAAVRVEDADHVGAVVHRDLRLMIDRRLDVLVVGVVVLALDREDGDVVLLDEGGGDVVLGRERVRRAEHDVGTSGLEGPHQVRRLARDVQARRDAVAGKRLLALEPIADRGQHRHLPVGPLDPVQAFGRKRHVLHIKSPRRRHYSLS